MTYAMTLDNSWEIMNEEEMYDVNGGWGWSTYTGANAWEEVAGMFASAIGCSVAGVKVAIMGLAVAPTIVGLIVFFAALGLGAGLFLLGSVTFVNAFIALKYTIEDGGFKSKSYTLFGIGITTKIERL